VTKRSRSRESKDKEKAQSKVGLDQRDIASLLIGEGLISKLISVVPQVIKHADTSTNHKDQLNAETTIERIFEVLLTLATVSDSNDRKQFCGQVVQRQLCNMLVEQMREPKQLTFLTTRQFLKLTQQLAGQPDEIKMIRKLAKVGFVHVQVEILHFYLSLIEHIQLSSIYDSLKLLNLFCKASSDCCVMACNIKGLALPLKHLLGYIEQKND